MVQVLRRLRRAPAFSLVVIATLGLAIGANVAIFAVVNTILLQPLPFPDSESLVGVWHTAPGIGIPELNQSPANHFIYSEDNRTFSAIGMHRRDTYTVTGQGDPQQVEGLTLTYGTLQALGTQPQIGRLISADDDKPNAPLTLMLTYGYWQQNFGGDPQVIGKNIQVNSKSYEIIGVMPRQFRFLNQKPMVIVPVRPDRSKTFVGSFNYRGLARLRSNATVASANADVARMIPLALTNFPTQPGLDPGMLERLHMGPLVRPLRKDVVGDLDKWLWVVMGTVGIVLLIACANIANLMLVRGEARQQELGVRAALGAGWRAIAWDMASESLALGMAGGAVGVALAWIGIRALVSAAPAGLPNSDAISLSPLVFGFALALSVLASLLFSVAPIWKYAGGRVSSALRLSGRSFSQGRERHRAQQTLVVMQVALALLLVIGSGLMLRTFMALRNVPPGFQKPEGIQAFRYTIPEAQVKDPEAVVRMQEQILHKLEQIPGVTRAAFTSSITMDGRDNNEIVFAEDRRFEEGALPPVRRTKMISPGTFETVGNPLLAGRDITWQDTYQHTPVVLISENFAKEWWGGARNALGKRIGARNDWREIVGVVGNEYDDGPDHPAPTVVYRPSLIKDISRPEPYVSRGIGVTLRTQRAGTESLTNEIRQAVWSVNSSLPVFEIMTLDEIYQKTLARVSFTLVLLVVAGLMALLLGLVGIYGVLAYTVAQKTKEIGIRMALGANAGSIVRMFTLRGMKLAAIGIACGLLAAVLSTRVMASLLYGVGALDKTTFAVVVPLVAVITLVASYVPSRKAARAVPVESLRAEG